MKIAVVVPTCRGFKIPETDMAVKWVVVHDRELHPVTGKRVDIVAPDPTLYGQGCDSIRSAGFLYALHNRYDYILTVDDDCEIPFNWVSSHLNGLDSTVHPWSRTVPELATRGTPYLAQRKRVAITHGLWSGVPDIDGKTQKHLPELRLTNLPNQWDSIHPPFTQSAMNLGFINEVGLVMYQPNQGEGTPFDRFADIWNGLIAQKCLSLHDYAFLNGGAVVHHTRQSNVDVNIVKEAPGMECHESFWQYVWDFNGKGTELVNTYAKLAYHIGDFTPPKTEWTSYFQQLKENMFRWIDETIV